MILYLQQFIQNKLITDLNVSKLVKAVYVQTVASSNFPYIYIGDFNSKNISTKDCEIAEIYFKAIIYFRDKNIKNVLEVSRNIKRLFNIDNEMKIILMRYLNEVVNLQNDGITQQIVMNFRALVDGDIKNV